MGILSGSWNLESLRKVFEAAPSGGPFPASSDRKAWNALLESDLNKRRLEILRSATRAFAKEPWQALPASLYMAFAREGSRALYEDPYFLRRKRLAVFALAEAMVDDGEFMDQVIDGVDLILSEPTWCIPAHSPKDAGGLLQDLNAKPVDLFVAETAHLLAELAHVLGDKIRKVSPSLFERLEREIIARAIEPVETDDSFWWLQGVNNWTPWCSSSVMSAAACVIKDKARLASLALRLMNVVDRFVDRYPDDGSCDEGPMYWQVASGAMLVFLETLHSLSGGAVDVYSNPKIARMGRFFERVHVAGPWFVNVGDARAKFETLRRAVIYRFGERVGDKSLRDLALLSMHDGWTCEGRISKPFDIPARQYVGDDFQMKLRELFWIPPEASPAELVKSQHVWLSGIGLLVARESTDSSGLLATLIAGHNDMSHNHNDCGHFTVYVDGSPAIVDVGVERYDKFTFSPERYGKWAIRASGHNAPVVNGVEQAAGAEFGSRIISESFQEGGQSMIVADLSKAYPSGAGIVSCVRSLSMNRNPGNAEIAVDDDVETRADGTVKINMFAAVEPTVAGNGLVEMRNLPRPLWMEFDAESFQIEIERLPLMDEWLHSSWGECLWRIALTSSHPSKRTHCGLRFRNSRPTQ